MARRVASRRVGKKGERVLSAAVRVRLRSRLGSEEAGMVDVRGGGWPSAEAEVEAYGKPSAGGEGLRRVAGMVWMEWDWEIIVI